MEKMIHPTRIQVLAIIGSILFLILIVELIRKKKIKEEYGLLWIFFSAVFIVIAVWRQGLEVLSRLLGIFYAPAAFLLILLVAVFLILLQYSIVLSRLSENYKTLVQELGILRMRIEEKDRISKSTEAKPDRD